MIAATLHRLRAGIDGLGDAVFLGSIVGFFAFAFAYGTIYGRPETYLDENASPSISTLAIASDEGIDLLFLYTEQNGASEYFDQDLQLFRSYTPGLFRSTIEAQPSLMTVAYPKGYDTVAQKAHSSIRLGGGNTLLVEVSEGSYLFDAFENAYYELTDTPAPLIMTDANQQTLLYVDRTNANVPRLAVTSPACHVERSAPLPASVDIEAELAFIGLPAQRISRVSLSSEHLAFVDHGLSPRIFVYNIQSAEVEQLLVPGYSQSQWHFSPYFIDDTRLAFSVLDGTERLTVEFDLQTSTYRTISDNFSDAIYRSTTGDVVLLQTTFDRMGDSINTPFGSSKLYERLTGGNTVAPRRGALHILKEGENGMETLATEPFATNVSLGQRPVGVGNDALLEALEVPEHIRVLFQENESVRAYYHIIDIY